MQHSQGTRRFTHVNEGALCHVGSGCSLLKITGSLARHELIALQQLLAAAASNQGVHTRAPPCHGCRPRRFFFSHLMASLTGAPQTCPRRRPRPTSAHLTSLGVRHLLRVCRQGQRDAVNRKQLAWWLLLSPACPP